MGAAMTVPTHVPGAGRAACVDRRSRAQGAAPHAVALIAAALLAATILPDAARAGRLERVRQNHILHCGAAPRSHVAEVSRSGFSGVAVDLCRAAAVALAGPRTRIAFRLYDSDRAFDAARRGDDDLMFLSLGEIADAKLAATISPGPAVFAAELSLMVARQSTARRPQDLAGRAICFMVASDAQRALDAAFRAWRLGFIHMAFEEDVELLDAYDVQRCAAAAGEATELARMQRSPGVNRLSSRILPQPLASFPIIAATPAGDPAWSAQVGLVLAALLPPAGSGGPKAPPQIGDMRQQAGR